MDNYGTAVSDSNSSSDYEYEEEPLPTYNHAGSASSGSSYKAPPPAAAPPGDSYGAPAADSAVSYEAPRTTIPPPLIGGYSDPTADLLPEYYKSEIQLGLNDPDDVPRVEPFSTDYGAPAAPVLKPVAEPDLTYGVPAAPVLSSYNRGGSSGYGR